MSNIHDGFSGAAERAAKTETASLKARLAVTTAQLHALEAEFERFVYRASHDLQGPLRTVLSFSELLESGYADELDETAQKYIRFAVGGARQGQRLVASLLALSRAGRETAGPRVSTNGVVANVVATYKNEIDECGATVSVGALPDVDIPEAMLLQVLTILIDNALNYRMDEAPKVEVTGTRTDYGTAVLSVADHGMGIEAKNHEAVFEAFFRAEHGKRAGVGLGLAVARKALASVGGTIKVDSSLGHGARFTLVVPLAPALIREEFP